MEEIDPQRCVLPALLALAFLEATTYSRPASIDPGSLKPGQTLKLAP